MNSARHWKKALPYYLQVSLRYSVIGWAAPLAVVLIKSLWIGLTKHRLVVNRDGLAFAAILGAFFFLLPLLTAVGDDFFRNRGVQDATIAWNPSLVVKTFLYLGALFFLVAAYLSYHQGAWISAGFILFSIASAITARVCL
jgi:hypothetical protein